jgi:hypothetical protein
MDFDEIFDNKHRRTGYQGGHSYNQNGRYMHDERHSGHGDSGNMRWVAVLDRIRSNKKLKVMVVMTGFLLLAIAAVVVIALFPLIVQLVNYISQNGLQGVYGEITSFVDKLWKGSGK